MPLSVRSLRSFVWRRWGRMTRLGILVVHDASSELAVAAARAACPNVAFDAEEVYATKDAAKACNSPVVRPTVLEGPVRKARESIHPPSNELNAMSTCHRRTIGAVIDSSALLIEET